MAESWEYHAKQNISNGKSEEQKLIDGGREVGKKNVRDQIYINRRRFDFEWWTTIQYTDDVSRIVYLKPI